MKAKKKNKEMSKSKVAPPIAMKVKGKKQKEKLGKKAMKKLKAQMLSMTDVEETIEIFDDQLPSRAEGTGRQLPKKVPKIRRAALTENVDENFIIVPWASREEWNGVCLQLHDGSYNDVIVRIAVWQRRVPALPVGVEATLFLLEAIVYDTKFIQSLTNTRERGDTFTEDQARSLYSLAIIRYLNHVSHLATQSLGESTRLTRELAAIVDTPEWLVALRNDVSHGPTAPSLEVLRMGGSFVLQWLKEKYWKLPGETQPVSAGERDPFTIRGSSEGETDIPTKISELVAAYIAARIHKLRRLQNITDPEIVRLLPTSLSSVKTKTAVLSLRNSLRSFLESHPVIFSAIVSQELIPSFEFYEDFSSLFNTSEEEGFSRDELIFAKLHGLWIPILKQLEKNGKLISILKSLSDIMINPDCEKMWMVAARWIDKLLEMVETSGKRFSKQLVSLLGTLIKHPNKDMEIFLERLFRLTEPRLGPSVIQNLTLLVSIWLDDKLATKKRKIPAKSVYFTLDDIERDYSSGEVQNPETLNYNRNESQSWMPDARGEEFWKNIPFGAVI